LSSTAVNLTGGDTGTKNVYNTNLVGTVAAVLKQWDKLRRLVLDKVMCSDLKHTQTNIMETHIIM